VKLNPVAHRPPHDPTLVVFVAECDVCTWSCSRSTRDEVEAMAEAHALVHVARAPQQ